MEKVIIFGCGRGAYVAKRYFESDSKYSVCGFTVESAYQRADKFQGLPVIAFDKLEETFPPNNFKLFIALGFQKMNTVRAEKYLAGKSKGYKFASYVSSKLVTHDNLNIGENCFILENNAINFDVKIGNNVVIWSSCQIGDLSRIEDHVWITSHSTVCGGTIIGEYSFLGANCTISDHIAIGKRTFVGANTLIVKDTNEGSVHITEGSKDLGIDSIMFTALLKKS